jgi:hypothetical protein
MQMQMQPAVIMLTLRLLFGSLLCKDLCWGQSSEVCLPLVESFIFVDACELSFEQMQVQPGLTGRASP